MKANLIVVSLVLAVCGVTSTAGVFNRDSFIRCARMASSGLCSSNEMLTIVRQQLNAAVQCNRTELSVTLSTECARDAETGAYCSEALFYVGDLIELATECTGRFLPGSCPANCISRLQALRDSLGCCINAVFNRTDTVYPDFLTYFTNEVWTNCGVDPVNTTCAGVIPFTPPQTVNTSSQCSYSAQISSDLASFCTPSKLELTNSTLNANGDCGDYVEYMRQLCSRDGNGDFCIATPMSTSDFTLFLGPIFSTCTDPSQCSPQCRDLIESFASDRDCCINSLYNSTYSQAIGFRYPFLENNDLFELCGVEPPPPPCTQRGAATQPRSFNMAGMLLLLLITMIVLL